MADKSYKDYLKMFQEQNTTSVPESQFSDIPSIGQDNIDRQKLVEDAVKAKRWSLIPQAIAGAGDTLSAANKVYGGGGNTGAQTAVNQEVAGNIANTSTQFEKGLTDNPTSDASKQYQNLLGKFLGKDPTSFAHMSASQIKDQIPAIEKLATMRNQQSLKEMGMAQTAMTHDENTADRKLREKELKANKVTTDAEKAAKHQDDLEKVAQDRVTQVRGDRSIQTVEVQRDAAITAYNRLNEIKKAGTGLNPVDYVDILGQVYKARTGTAPTDTVLKHINQSTAKGKLGEAYTFATGKQAPATTDAIADSLQQMVGSMGEQADKLHDGYMASRLSMGKDLAPDRAERIAKLGRGLSFAEATKSADTTPTAPNVVPAVGSIYHGRKVFKVTRIK